jgi:hypothetical protein
MRNDAYQPLFTAPWIIHGVLRKNKLFLRTLSYQPGRRAAGGIGDLFFAVITTTASK